MSEEKMREALPCPFCGGQVDPDGWLDGNGKRGPECWECGATAESMDVWNSRAALQESEAGAVACWRVVDEKGEPQTDWVGGDPVEIDPINKDHKVQFAYLAPPSAQAIETAAIMKCAEVCDRHAHSTWNDDRQAQAKLLRDELRALIPQGVQTQLEEFGMKCIDEASALNPRLWTEHNLRAIVTNLIGENK